MSTNGLFSIAGKTALVTGGSRGVGLMIARGFVEAGAKVYIASRSADVCDKVAAELSNLPGDGECISLPTDVSTQEGCQSLADAVAEREDALDILVNNAGIQGALSMRRHDEDVWRDVLAVNLQAVFHLTRTLRPMLEAAAARRDDDPARVLNIGSVAGLRPQMLEAYAYASSKAALHHLTMHLARAFGPEITVNALALGPFESKMMETTLAVFGDTVARAVPLKRIGRPDDVAGAALFLTSRAGSYVTGAVIPVEGGWANLP
jgi:NAD(P)-dependent dehydrogenase (short-subunit alcohol dehydrogenase family)